ncbi:MAG: hypothetical protein LUH00_05205 [Lachnospiraceae bacterium]|nr:hypothetical protein [Lachnospiraceae bacterium]
MKRKRWFHVIPMMVMCLLFLSGLAAPHSCASEESGLDEPAAVSSSSTVKKGLVKIGSYYYYYKKDGTKLTNKWKTIDGYRYYFKSSGKAAVGGYKIGDTVYVFGVKGRLKTGKKSRFLTINGKTYYVSAQGTASTGWFVVNGKLYRATSGGKISTRTVDGITFTESGAAVDNTESRLKIKVMQVIADITTESMSQSEKLKACWNYMTGSGWTYVQYNTSFSSGWQKQCAYDMLVKRRGDCKSFACAFAALACEIGYDAYVIRGRVPGTRDQAADGYTKHSWVRIDGRYFDPEGDWAGWNKGCYNYSSYNVSHTIQQIIRFMDD